MTVALIDTSIVCELLEIPGKSRAPRQFRTELVEKTKAGEILLLPLTAIIETGNHIGQCTGGTPRRLAAMRFVKTVRQAILGEAPFRTTPMFEPDALEKWLGEFVDWVGPGAGFGNLSIKKEWDHQCQLNPGHRVYIWTLDQHLLGFDRSP